MNCSQAKGIPIQDYLGRKGVEPARTHGTGLWYHSPLSECDHTPSFEVSPDGRMFHDWSSGAQGTIIDLATALTGGNISAALVDIEQTMGVGYSASAPSPNSFFSHPQESPFNDIRVGALRHPALIAYARSRRIPRDIATKWLKEVHYSISGRTHRYYALGFENQSGGFELRNAVVKQSMAPKDVTVAGDLTGCTWLVFEGSFDFLSAVVLGWYRPDCMNALILNSTANIGKALPLLADAARVCCLLDNDDTGRATTRMILDAVPNAKDYSHHYARFDDLNECLCARRNCDE